MIRITLHYVWSLAETLEPLANLDANKLPEKFDLAMELFGPQNALEALLQGSVFSPNLRSSVGLAGQLLEFLRTQTKDLEGKTIPGDVWTIKNAYSRFKIAFLAELGTLPTYFVSQKGSHDTLTLLEQGWRLFPDDLEEKVPEAMFDAAEAGKALCYQLPTACGFHVFRATEAVLRRYYTHVTGGKPQPKVRNIMVYVQAMRQANCGDEKILSVIEQLSKLHRNPLIHPEVALTEDEAISALGMARSVVSAMISVLPPIPPTTTAAPPDDGAEASSKSSQRRVRKRRAAS